MDNWDKTQTRQLISFLRQCPCLYDPKDPDFMKKTKRNEKYNFILNEMKPFKKNITVQQIKSKIRTLNRQMWREERQFLAHKNSGSSEEYIPKLWSFNDLSFLSKYNDTIQSTSKTKVPSEKSKGVLPIKKQSKLSQQLTHQATEALNIAKIFVQRQMQVEKEEEFCRYLCTELDKIASENTLQKLKMEVLQLVSDTITEERNTIKKIDQCNCATLEKS